MKRFGILLAGGMVACGLVSAQSLFTQDFSKVEPGALPDEYLILDGQFAVKEDAGNRFAELPGAPLESFGFLFGPNEPSGVEAAARVYATKSGRKFPTFGLGLNGASGYRLQVAPAKEALELLRGDVVVASVPFKWQSGGWTQLRLALRKTDAGFRLEGSAWADGSPAPKEPSITFVEAKPQPAGKASVWGLPFSGTPLRFDDLGVTRLGG